MELFKCNYSNENLKPSYKISLLNHEIPKIIMKISINVITNIFKTYIGKI